jgi:hypothetical protein
LDRETCDSQDQWQKQREGRIKLDMDASFIPESGETTVGIIGRDHLGRTIIAASLGIEACRDAEEAEACAIREGLKLGLDHNLLPASIESDCAIAVTATNKSSAIASRKKIYKDIEVLLSATPGCDILKTRRTCNSVAHHLARIARAGRRSRVWLPPVLDFISELCVKDIGANC